MKSARRRLDPLLNKAMGGKRIGAYFVGATMYRRLIAETPAYEIFCDRKCPFEHILYRGIPICWNGYSGYSFAFKQYRG